MCVTTMGLVPARPLLAPIDEESASMEDGDGGEDKSMQDEAEEGPSSGNVRTSPRARTKVGEHQHFAIYYVFLKANNPHDPADQESNRMLTGAEAKHGLILAMAQERVMMHHGLRSGLVGLVGQSNGLLEV